MNETPPAILFVCVENSCRSQIAEAFARMLGGDRVRPASAGSHPSGQVNPGAIATMAELGYDLSGHRSQALDDFRDQRWDRAVTMGCGDACPFVPAERRVDWAIPDPKHMDPAGFARVRDQIRDQVRGLLEDLGVEVADR